MRLTNSGMTRVAVKDSDSRAIRSYECPQTVSQYVEASRREVVTVQGISPDYVAWVDTRLRKQGK